MALKRKAAPPEEVFEDLEDLEEDEELEDLEEEAEDDEDLEEEEEEAPRPRKAAKKAVARKKPIAETDPREVIEHVLVKGITAFIEQMVDEKVNARMGDQELEEEEVPAPRRRKVAAKPAQRSAKAVPARKASRPTATIAEVREWAEEEGYEVSSRGRLSEPLKKEFMKATKKRIV